MGQNPKANKHSLLQKVKKTQSLTIAYFNEPIPSLCKQEN